MRVYSFFPVDAHRLHEEHRDKLEITGEEVNRRTEDKRE